MPKAAIYIRSLFFLIIILLYIFTYYTLSFNILTGHDFIFGYGRTFIYPEHGRYIATFINCVFSEYLPYLLNIHPNDFIPMVVSPIKAFLVILFALLFSNSLFLLNRKENEIFKFEFSNFAYLILFIFSFFVIFNNNYFFSYTNSFFATLDSTAFWEYPFSLFYFVILFNLLIYYIVNQKVPCLKNYILILFFTFLTGLSLEIINAPLLIPITLLYILLLINYKKFDKITNLKFLSVYFIYILAIILYYCNSNDSSPIYGDGGFINYLHSEFHNFLLEYKLNIIKEMQWLIFPAIFFSISSLFFIKNKNLCFYSIFILITIFSFLLCYLSVFVLGYSIFCIGTDTCYWCSYQKWLYMLKIILLFLLLNSIYVFIVSVLYKNNKWQDIAKVILCTIFLIIFFNSVIGNYYENVTEWIAERKDARRTSYMIEKIAINQNPKEENIIVPIKYDNLLEADNLYFLSNIKYLHYPELSNKKNMVYDENYVIDQNLFSEQELKNPKFQSLLKHRIHKNEYDWLLHKALSN